MNGLLEGGEGPSSSSLHSLLVSVDLHGAITRMYQEMDARPEEIVGSFADSEERVSATMELEEFTKHLFSTTEQLSKTDAALLAIRFFDGELVSIPDFLEFFISTPTSRRAKASAAAVRVGLNLLELQQSATKGGPEYDGSEEEDGELDKSKTCVWTTELHKAVRKLRAIFPQVDAALTLALDEEAEENEGNNNKAEIITASAFKVFY